MAQIPAYYEECWGRMEMIKCSEKVTNGRVLERIGEKTIPLNNILHILVKANWVDRILRRNCLLHGTIDGQIAEVKRVRRRKTKLLDDLRIIRRYWELKQEAEDRERWEQQFINRT